MKKILTIVALSIIGILAATTIILACIRYNFTVISLDEVSAATIYYGTNYETFEKDQGDKEQLDKVLDLYKKGSRQNLLNAIFQGNIGKNNTVSRSYTNELQGKIGQSGTVAIELAFNTPRNLVLNGKEYEYETSSTNKTKVSYQYATIIVSNSSSIEEYTIYLYAKNNASSPYYKVTGLGSYTALYSYITSYDNWTVA